MAEGTSNSRGEGGVTGGTAQAWQGFAVEQMRSPTTMTRNPYPLTAEPLTV